MTNLKAILAVAVGTVFCIGAATAADLPTRTKAPVMAVDPAYNWSGWYGGLNGGYIERDGTNVTGAEVSNDFTRGAAIYAGLAAAAATGNIPRSEGGLAGIQIGYNWRFNRTVVGIEADIDGASAQSSTQVAALTPAPGGPLNPLSSTFIGSQKLDYIGTVRGRVGVLSGARDALLLYATGGLAYGHVSSSVALNQLVAPLGGCLVCFAPYSTTINSSSTRAGWIAGPGAEWMFAPNWSVNAEALYYDLGGFSTTGLLSHPGLFGLPFTLTSVRVDNRTTGVLARAGVNWHFSGPIVAPY